MQIDKETILEFLRERGQEDQAQQAEGELPEQVDTDRDAGLLEKYGIDPQALIAKVGGSSGLSGL